MDPIRTKKSPIPPDKITGADSAKTPSATPAAAEKLRTASAKEFLQHQSPAYTVDRDTGKVNFGSGISGKIPPSSEAAGKLLQETRSAISQYLQGAQPTEDLFAAMMQYLKMAQGEAREDRKLQRASKETALAAKESRLGLDNDAIDKGMQEAGAKANIAMEQAAASLVMGMATAVASLKEAAAQAKQGLGHSSPAMESRYGRLMVSLDGLAGGSVKMPSNSSAAEAQVKRLENLSSSPEDAAKRSRGHADAIRDAVLDFLRKLSEINPKL